MEKHILILTDFVGYGNVAMATARAVLTRMGHRVYCLPTALISNTWNFGSCAQLDTTEYLKTSWESSPPDAASTEASPLNDWIFFGRCCPGQTTCCPI